MSFSSLNPEQKQAALHDTGPLLVVAGAGAGKTRVLTERIAYLIKEHNVSPFKILAVTFTNKAAREMKERINKSVGDKARDIWVGTFHSICGRILRHDIEHLGWSRNFVIFDTDDQLSIIKKIVKELELDQKKFKPGTVLGAISRAKNELIDADSYARRAGDYFEENISIAYRQYQKKLFDNNALDFDDLLMFTVELFRKNPKVLEYYQNRFLYINVDEYQDTNHSQYMLIKLLAEKHKNICVVGDSDQSIYAWRGADFKNILNFESDYPDAKTVVLEQNYRSTQNILDVSNNVIKNNSQRRPKNLWTKNEAGEKAVLYTAVNEEDEARFIISEIQKLTDQFNYGAFVVLYRTNAQSRIIEETLLQNNIPYRIFSGIRFYERKEIKDILSYLRVIFNPADDISFGRIFSTLLTGIGKTTFKKLETEAIRAKVPMLAAITKGLVQFSGQSAVSINNLVEFIKNMRVLAEKAAASEVIEEVIKKSGYKKALEAEETEEALARLENIEELITVAREFEKLIEDNSLASFLTQISLVTDQDSKDEGKPSVTLMTLHAAKGLEFPVVFMAGMDEGVFPHRRSMFDQDQLEEERRLCYVGMTRSQKKLYLITAADRMLFGQSWNSGPSRFIAEIPENLIEERKNPILEGATRSKEEAVELSRFAIGDMVEHPKWGKGKVLSVSDEGAASILEVRFEVSGMKSLMLKYAPLRKI